MVVHISDIIRDDASDLPLLGDCMMKEIIKEWT